MSGIQHWIIVNRLYTRFLASFEQFAMLELGEKLHITENRERKGWIFDPTWEGWKNWIESSFFSHEKSGGSSCSTAREVFLFSVPFLENKSHLRDLFPKKDILGSPLTHCQNCLWEYENSWRTASGTTCHTFHGLQGHGRQYSLQQAVSAKKKSIWRACNALLASMEGMLPVTWQNNDFSKKVRHLLSLTGWSVSMVSIVCWKGQI